MKNQKDKIEIIAANRKARHLYQIFDRFEAGISLEGPEVKSLRLKQANISHAFARVENDRIFLYAMHIAPYKFNTIKPLDPLRTRELLLNKKEIKKISSHTASKGMTVIPLELYFKNGWAKICIALCKGKKTADKSGDIKEREIDREMQRKFREKYKG
ncbi:MAG: SsrA-binding protein SmpB [Elusimicrobia bacterium]|nr:SsrA-binding protein SmpB [Elusimicrobiota bacterium]